MRRSAKTTALLSLLASWSLGAFAKDHEKVLDIDAVKHFQISIESSLHVVRREGNNVWTGTENASFFVSSQYDESAKEADLGFGTAKNPIEGSERVDMGEGGRRIRGIERDRDALLFLDSAKLQVLAYQEADKRWQRPKDLILDLVKPARDAKGEATRKEQAALIARLRSALSKVKGRTDLIGGMTTVPPAWKDGDGSRFLLWLRLPEAALLTVKCGEACVAQRSCFIKGLSESERRAVSGIARDGDRVLLGLPSEGKVLQLTGRSCFSLKASPAFRIPPRIKAMTNLFVDEGRNLWMTSAIPDDFTSASLFVWGPETWTR